MATITINGQQYTLPDGEKLNAIQAAKRFGVTIPYYCWHPALSVVANCRMCEIEVGSRDAATGEVKMVPKLVPGCQTPVRDGSVLVTDSEKVQKHQRMIMEFLLINHPLDCPVCDQAGQCGLQDYSYQYGQAAHRFVEERTVNPRKDVSEKIQLNQDRCIMCTRCVRFTREITGTGELQVMRRGHHAEIAVFPGHELDDNPLAGNVVDLCPVGALLDKEFLHRQRAWYLNKKPIISPVDAGGQNAFAEVNKGKIWRVTPRHNPHVNDYWISDEARYGFQAAHDRLLLHAMYHQRDGDHREVEISEALELAGRLLRQASESGPVVGVLSPFLTVEEAYLMASYLKGLNAENVLALGPVPVRGEDLTIRPDKTANRNGDTSFLKPKPFTIYAEKCPNRRGVSLVLEHFQGEVIPFEVIADRITAGEFSALHIALDALQPWDDQALAERLRGGVETLIVQDTTITPLAQVADLVLASSTFAEKDGSYVNAEGRLQRTHAALTPRDGSLPALDILAILTARFQAPLRSRDVLADLGANVPAFAAVAKGDVPEFGVDLDAPEPADQAASEAAVPSFSDPWTPDRHD